MKLIDTHCHFDDPAFDSDREKVWGRAHEAGVKAIIIPGIGLSSWPRVKHVCDHYRNCFPAYGFHPMFMQDHLLHHREMLAQWLTDESAVAVGECGLDFYIDNPDREAQIALFEHQISLSVVRDLPLIIHARKSVEQVIGLIKRYPSARGVLHSFSGSLEQARVLTTRGFYLSFGGPLTYSKSTRLRRIVTELPLNSLMLETDSPDQPDAEIRGQRNIPERLVKIFDEFCKLRPESRDEIEETLLKNATTLFQLTPESLV